MRSHVDLRGLCRDGSHGDGLGGGSGRSSGLGGPGRLSGLDRGSGRSLGLWGFGGLRGSGGRAGSRAGVGSGVGSTGKSVCETLGDRTDGGLDTLTHITGPTANTVGDIRGVAVSSTTLTEVAGGIDGAGVVGASGLVVPGSLLAALGGEALLQTITGGSACGSVTDHSADHVGSAGSGLGAVLVTGASSIVALHQTGVLDTVVGGLDADTALALLHDNGKDESLIDIGFLGDIQNARSDVGSFFVGVVARSGDQDFVEAPAVHS